MADGPADRAAIANGAVGDAAGDALHGAARDVGNASVLDVGMGDAGPEHEFVAAALGLLELGKGGDVDDQPRLDQPQIEHGTKRLAAGNDLGGSFGLAEHGKRRLQVARTFVAERRGFHAAGLSASRAAKTASTTRYGVIGDCISSAPSGRSASLTALTIAAGGAIAPPSPVPFTPNCV